jgi:hypothetical protein
MHNLPLFSCKHSKCFDSKVGTVSDRMYTDSTPGTMPGYWNRTSLKNYVWLIYIMSIFNIKQSYILYQTFGNIYTIAPFWKHALRIFHAITPLILLAHAQTNFSPVHFQTVYQEMRALIQQQRHACMIRAYFHRYANCNFWSLVKAWFYERFFSAKCEIFRLFLLNCEQSSRNNLFE